MSKYAMRVSPRYQATAARSMSTRAPRSYRIHWPSPCADQRVARLLSSVFCGRLPSFALATTDTTGNGVRAAETASCLGMLWDSLGSVRSRSHASAKTTLVASAAFKMASRLDSLNLKFILGRSFYLGEGWRRAVGLDPAAGTVRTFSRTGHQCHS